MLGALRVTGAIIGLTIVFLITGNPTAAKEVLHLEATWQLLLVQAFGLATIRVFWSWPFFDRALETIMRMFRGEHLPPDVKPSEVKPPVARVNRPHMVTLPKPVEREPAFNPHYVSKAQVGLTDFYGFVTPMGVRELCDAHINTIKAIHDNPPRPRPKLGDFVMGDDGANYQVTGVNYKTGEPLLTRWDGGDPRRQHA